MRLCGMASAPDLGAMGVISGPSPRTCASIIDAASNAVAEVDALLAPILAQRKPRAPRATSPTKGEPVVQRSARQQITRTSTLDTDVDSDCDVRGNNAQARVRSRVRAAGLSIERLSIPLTKERLGTANVDMQALRRKCPVSTGLREIGDCRRLTAEDVRRACDEKERRQKLKTPQIMARSASAPTGITSQEAEPRANGFAANFRGRLSRSSAEPKLSARDAQERGALANAEVLPCITAMSSARSSKGPERASSRSSLGSASREVSLEAATSARSRTASRASTPRRSDSQPILDGQAGRLRGGRSRVGADSGVHASHESVKQRRPVSSRSRARLIPPLPQFLPQQGAGDLQSGGSSSSRRGAWSPPGSGEAARVTVREVSKLWDPALALVRIFRCVRRWMQRRRVAAGLLWKALHGQRLSYQVRLVLRQRTKAASAIQRQWRGFDVRVGLFVEGLAEGPWRVLEQKLLDQIFTACPLEEEVSVGDDSRLRGEQGSPVQKRRAFVRQLSSKSNNGSSRSGSRASSAKPSASSSQRPWLRPKSAERKAMMRQDIAERRRQEDDFDRIMCVQFRKRVLQRVRAHALLGDVVRLLLRREVVERLYERIGYAIEASFPDPACRASVSVRQLLAAVGGSVTPLPLGAKLPAAGRLALEDVAELVLCAQRKLGVCPVQAEQLASFYRGCAPWRLEAIEGHVKATRTLREGLVDRWSARWSAWRPAQSSPVKESTLQTTLRSSPSPNLGQSGRASNSGSRSSSKCSATSAAAGGMRAVRSLSAGSPWLLGRPRSSQQSRRKGQRQTPEERWHDY